MSSSEGSSSGSTPRQPRARAEYLFADVEFTAPLAELRAVSERRIRTYEDLGENERAEKMRRAWKLARDRLARLLGEEG